MIYSNLIYFFRFILCSSFKIITPQVVTGMEVLALAQTWNATNFYKIFQEKFLQNVLTSTNVALVLSYASQYNLKEVVDACKDISPDNAVLSATTPRKRQKICLVSISTYMEPLEIIIPFEPIEADISASFKKGISNKFIFRAISGCYSIKGFQVQLNEEYLSKKDQKEENKSMLEIDYSIKNGNEEIEGRAEKPLCSINVIHFKKPLVIKPKEVGEITVETEIEPYLCSAHLENKLRIKSSDSELELIMESNRKVPNPERKLFLVGKFFYHVTEFPKKTGKQ